MVLIYLLSLYYYKQKLIKLSTMPYISTEEVREKRNLIKKEFPNFKFSITRRHASTIMIHILEGPIDMSGVIENGHESVNHYHIDEFYNDYPKISELLKSVYKIANKSNHTESTDGDYGNIPSFYVDISIGRWNRKYKQVNK